MFGLDIITIQNDRDFLKRRIMPCRMLLEYKVCAMV